MSEEMTRKEVIWQLKGLLLGELRTTTKERKALEYAISSLETDEAYQLEYERTTKNDLVTLTFSKGTLKYSCKDYVVYKKDWLRSHYGAEIDIMFGDSQYKEPTTKNDLGVDCKTEDYINKRELIQKGMMGCDANGKMLFIIDAEELDSLPNATPKNDNSVLEDIKAALKMITSNRGFLSCSVGYIHKEIDRVFDEHISGKE